MWRVRSPVDRSSTKTISTTGDLVASVVVAARFALTDAQWAVLEPLLSVGKRPGRPRRWSRRPLVDGIRWRVRTGAPWRDVPPVYGSWQAVYGLFRRWRRAGVWDVSVDSTIARAHQHAAGLQVVLRRIRVRRPGRGRPRTRLGRVLADKAYGSRGNRAYLRGRGIRCTIPEKSDQIRNRKNRGSGGGWPSAFRYDKLAVRYEATIHVAAINEWLRL
jgi:transposase